MRSAVPRRYYSVISPIVRQSIDYRNSRRRHDVRESRSTAAAVLKARAISAAARSYRAPGARSARALADRQGRRTGYRTHGMPAPKLQTSALTAAAVRRPIGMVLADPAGVVAN